MNRVLGVLAAMVVLTTGCASRGAVSRVASDVAKLRSELADTRAAQDSVSRDLARAQSEFQALDARTRELGAGIRAASEEAARLAGRMDAADEAIRKTRELVGARPTRGEPSVPAARRAEPRAESREARASRGGTPEAGYAAALATFRAREYGQAVLDFIDFIAKYPRHALAANAQYWIGEAYYVQHDFRQALLEFQKVVEMGSGKVPDALVKVGLSYWGLRDPGRARAAWQRVAREHSGTESATLARSLLRKHTASRQ